MTLFPSMEQGKNTHLFQDSWLLHYQEDEEDQKPTSSSSSSSSIGEESTVSNQSSISCDDTADDASSSSSSPSNSSYDLSEIMAQLPIKRGLSKFYNGKSESFTSLSRVTSIEELAKKAIPCRRSLKASKSCGLGLNNYKPYTLPKAVITKKSAKGSFFSSFPSKRVGFMSSKPPVNPSSHNKLEC
ncbi:hypothetical protein ABFS82_09G111500 [Erythranthe guttata]|uniref:Oxidative stress 3 n=1 Tax=Erythranthe guttata TaxID=4155 RepID=A0A022Q4M8_ERYGU|nr:PREDICTED: uncharacterized serine-rich protein C215.13-like [Erythranthe guttata]EYU21445.1 hypothetical protein MIMGU_mgv1a014566mg [Erythranthe guttata]|eukprot:XP_012856674.1 PREDICTED: uncharacterized serine-rich protein C215.13-like [Erythranthe guttata]